MIHTDGVAKTPPYIRFYLAIEEIGAFTETSMQEGEQ